MTSATQTFRLAVFALTLGGTALRGNHVGHADEPVQAFVEALCQRQYFDEALAYLAYLRRAPILSSDEKQRLQFDEAQVFTRSAQLLTDAAAREKALERAREKYGEFIEAHADHTLRSAAKIEQASILVDQARASLAGATGSHKTETRASAERLLRTAQQQFAQADAELQARLRKLPTFVSASENGLRARRDQLASDLVKARLMNASVDYELGKAAERDSTDAQQRFRAAAAKYAAIFEQYRTRTAGLVAHLWAGRCYQELGDLQRAIGCYRDLIDLPVSPETRSIRDKSLRQALECWVNATGENSTEAMERGERWIKDNPASETDADGTAIHYFTAVAYKRAAEALPTKDPQRTKLLGNARALVAPIAKHSGEFQQPARILLAAVPSSKKKDKNKEPKEIAENDDEKPRSFADALERVRDALGRMQESAEAARAAGQENDRETAAKLEKESEAHRQDALADLRLAFSLDDKSVPAADRNEARYYLCYLKWELGDFYDAAVLGEFLATRYPDSPQGRQAGRIALAAYVKIYAELPEANKDFAVTQVERIAEYIVKRWPDEEEGQIAAGTLMDFAAQQRNYGKVLQYLTRIPADSPRRGQAELKAGQCLWSAYVRGLQVPQNERPPQEELGKLREQAQTILEKGIERERKSGQVDAALVAAAYSLAQIYVDTSQPAKAIELLENPQFGPLTLVKSKNPTVARQGFATEIYKLALRAYVAVQPQQLKKAETAMDALEQLVSKSGDSKADNTLTQIYVSLGHELQRQLQELHDSGNTKELAALSQGFEIFLNRILQRQTGNSIGSLSWVAETFYSLASSFDDDSGNWSPQANRYFEQAVSAYQRMLKLVEDDPKFPNRAEVLTGIRLRLAECEQHTGKFPDAIARLTLVLRDRPMLLPAQIEVAETFQAQGAVDRSAYVKAIRGAEPDKEGRNVIWGWAKLAKMTMNNPKFDDTFHKARLNMAECRLSYGLTEKDPAKKEKILDAAKQDIRFTYKLYPKMGGSDMYARYERLLKRIQRGLGQEPHGFEEFREAAESKTTEAAN